MARVAVSLYTKTGSGSAGIAQTSVQTCVRVYESSVRVESPKTNRTSGQAIEACLSVDGESKIVRLLY